MRRRRADWFSPCAGRSAASPSRSLPLGLFRPSGARMGRSVRGLEIPHRPCRVPYGEKVLRLLTSISIAPAPTTSPRAPLMVTSVMKLKVVKDGKSSKMDLTRQVRTTEVSMSVAINPSPAVVSSSVVLSRCLTDSRSSLPRPGVAVFSVGPAGFAGLAGGVAAFGSAGCSCRRVKRRSLGALSFGRRRG